MRGSSGPHAVEAPDNRDFRMRPSIIAVLLLPLLFLVGALVSTGVGIVRVLRRREFPHHMKIVGMFVGLLLIDGVLSIVIIVDARLSHSEAAKAASPLRCLALFLVLVVIPAVALFVAVRRVRSAHRATSPGRS